MRTVESLVNKVKKIKTKADFNQFIQSVSSNETYTWAGLILFKTVSASQIDTLVYGDMPEAYQQWLEQRADLKRLDYQGMLPHVMSADKVRVIRPSADVEGLLVVPFVGVNAEHGCLVLALNEQGYNQKARQLEKMGWYWSVVLPYLYEAHCRLFRNDVAKITKREMQCICWASEGKTSWEISKILNISERTVNFHLANCIQKTGSVNRQQAIAKCLLQGQLLSA